MYRCNTKSINQSKYFKPACPLTPGRLRVAARHHQRANCDANDDDNSGCARPAETLTVENCIGYEIGPKGGELYCLWVAIATAVSIFFLTLLSVSRRRESFSNQADDASCRSCMRHSLQTLTISPRVHVVACMYFVVVQSAPRCGEKTWTRTV